MEGLLSLFMAGRQSVRVAVSYHLAHRRVLPSHTIIANYIFLGLAMCGRFVVSLSAYTPICTLHVLYVSVANQRHRCIDLMWNDARHIPASSPARIFFQLHMCIPSDERGLLFHMYVAVIARSSETNIAVDRVQRSTLKRQFAVTVHISDLANIV